MILDIVTYILLGITLLSALAIAYTNNVVQAAFLLLLTLFGVAGVYVLSYAEFLAIAQIMIYIGGVLILLLFAILFFAKTNTSVETRKIKFTLLNTVALLSSFVLFGILLTVAMEVAEINSLLQETSKTNNITSIEGIGSAFLTTHLLPFEFISITLIGVLIGASYLVRTKAVKPRKIFS
jgi:NADH:ubiquinone oxidoreductase subunit 6 (subunit J)